VSVVNSIFGPDLGGGGKREIFEAPALYEFLKIHFTTPLSTAISESHSIYIFGELGLLSQGKNTD